MWDTEEETVMISYSDIARQFLKEHGVHRYRMKKVSEMTDSEVCQYCHWYYEEKGLVKEWRIFRNQFEVEYCHCRYLYELIDAGTCYDLQMIGLGYIKEDALPDVEIDRPRLQQCCAGCKYSL